MKGHGVAFLLGITFLILFEVKGTPLIGSRRCFCINPGSDKISLRSLKDLKQFAPSPSCEKTEIIATKKNGDQTCLNPDSTKVKQLVKQWKKQVSQAKKQKKGKKVQKIKRTVKIERSKVPR
ncbi:C-X-C motif chemokine 9 [Octodon degus]|uniref:C-X-C motif chemokine n=1 Tax=Octodon degus TaxID=10160 RepID=A0A6P3FHT6_OCTDE|nr:C-X-C motif chemokine 9 [Octodon degus]